MDCTQINEYLDAYVDGFLSAEEKEQVEAHLAECADCKKEAEALMRLRGEIRALKLENTDDFVFDMARASHPVALPLLRRRWVRSIGAVAACLVLFVGVYTAVQNGYQSPVPQEPVVQEPVAHLEDTAEPVLAAAEDAVAAESQPAAYVSQTPKAGARTVQPEAEEEYIVLDSITVARSDYANAGFEIHVYSGADNASHTKRLVTLAVPDAVRDSFVAALAEITLSEFAEETVIDEANLEQLFALEGVTVETDVVETTESDAYAAKVVIVY